MQPKEKNQILVVDDDRAVGMVLSGLLKQAGYDALHVASALDALSKLSSRDIDLVITDLQMPEMDGMELLREIRERIRDLPVIMLTAHGSVEHAVQAMKLGASDFLLKPFDRDEVLFTVNKALVAGNHAAEQPVKPDEPVAAGTIPCAESEVMEEVLSLVAKAAKTPSTVLLGGETGSGKEVVARAIHAQSPRAQGPFVPVHCAALPEQLLESELFGYEKGAFTGATHRKPGRVELAHGGTLFLDEIGDISASVQVKLLRLLQEREYERLGGVETQRADVRFLAATHKDLEQMVEDGEFREDLYYRLNVIPIWVPPLRDRREDIPLLTQRFCREMAEKNGRDVLTFSKDALQELSAHDWPGNVRQLSNFVERLVVFAEGDVIDVADVAREMGRGLGRKRSAASGVPAMADAQSLGAQRGAAERQAIVEALEKAGKNRSKAARILGISRRTLYNKLSEFDLN